MRDLILGFVLGVVLTVGVGSLFWPSLDYDAGWNVMGYER